MPSIVDRIGSGRTLELTSRIAARTVPWRNGALVTLTYHRLRVAGNEDLYPGLATVDPQMFALQMTELARNWSPVSLGDVLDAVEGRADLPSRAVLVTFDDGYRDFGEVAWPIMAELGIRPTLFVVTGHATDPGRWFWWDRLYRALGRDAGHRFGALAGRVKELPHADAMALVDAMEERSGAGLPRRRVTHDWDELARLESEGVDIAPHTVTHPLLHRSPVELIAAELRQCWAEVRSHLIAPVPAFAYPDGGLDPAVVRLLRDTDMKVAFTTERGGSRPHRHDPLTIPRVNVGRRTDLTLLRGQMALFGGLPRRSAPSPGDRYPLYSRKQD